MIVDFHEQCRRCPHFPGVVAKSFSQRMTPYDIVDSDLFRSLTDNSVGLISGKRLSAYAGAGEQIVLRCSVGLRFSVFSKNFFQFFIDENTIFFAGLFFRDQNVRVKTVLPAAIDIISGEMKNIVDAERCVETESDQSVIPLIGSLCPVIIFESLE